MSQLSEELVKKAQNDQNKYWENLYKDFVFFKKSEIDFSIFELDAYDGLFSYYEDNVKTNMKNGYPWLAKYWATNYLEHHCSFYWLRIFANAKTMDMNDKQASSYADAQLKVYKAHYKAIYP